MNMRESFGIGSAVSGGVNFAIQAEDVVEGGHFAATDDETVAVSIVSNSRLLSEGLFVLLATRIPLQIIAHYRASSPIEIPMPNPAGHVVLLDSNIGRDFAQLWIRYWCTRTPSAHVLVLEMANDVELIVDSIEAGVGGYILQGESIEVLVQAVREVQQGLAKCSPEVTGRLCARLMAARQIINNLAQDVFPLTPRELEVLGYIAQNLSNQEIATLLVIEVRTVKHHVHNILEKLQFNNRRDAALHAAKQGWLTNP